MKAARLSLLAFAPALFTFSAVAQAPGIHETAGLTIGYPTPADAIAALRSKPGVVLGKQQDWLLATEPAEHVYWAFPPPSNPAYPAAVKRVLVLDGNSIYVKMAVLCGGTKPACDGLVQDFERLNDGLRETASHLPGNVGGPPPK